SVYYHLKRGLSLEDAVKLVSTYRVEGIGEDILPRTMDLDLVDNVVVVDDQNSFSMARLVARLEGLLIGGSSGSALYGALKYIINNNISGKTVVVIFPDTGRNYLTKFYNDEWMVKNGFETDETVILKNLRHR
ncbi:TPA: pyridoxal-phosphate dependent enzyme, partial [Candidatus Geothermarchaeota archaeon]|nr:pyridoxal-phosphate dependent enzyme [Candidatus Geothermarchaeota archaeon]